jgi:translation initiation factor 2 subunit 1
VDCIRNAIASGMTEVEDRVVVQYVGAPRYRVVISAPDYKAAEEELKDITNKMIVTIRASGGEGAFHRDGK